MGSGVGHFADGSKNVIFPQVLLKKNGFLECLQGSPLGGCSGKGLFNKRFRAMIWPVRRAVLGNIVATHFEIASEVSHFAKGSKNVIFPHVLLKKNGFLGCLQGSPLEG